MLFPGVAPPVVLRGRGGGAAAPRGGARGGGREPRAAGGGGGGGGAGRARRTLRRDADGSRGGACARPRAGCASTPARAATGAARRRSRPDGSAAVRTLSVLVARPPRLGVERTLVLP
ncbi:MAG: hypothetical protein V9F04_14870 [Dermatophilaceae bacterium]